MECLATTVYNKEGSLTRKVLSAIRGKTYKKASNRKDDLLPEEKVIQFCEFEGLICTYIAKFRPLRQLYMHLNNHLNDRFGKKVAKYAITNNVDVVVSFDNNSMALFQYLKIHAPNIKRVMDVSIANRTYLKTVYENDLLSFKDMELKTEQKILWNANYMERIVKEIEFTEYFLVASSFVKKSLHYSNVDEERIYLVPYGVDTSKFNIAKDKAIDNQINLIYVGGITYRKGLHHLLSVVSKLEGEGIKLTCVGEINYSSPIYKKYSETSNIRFVGFLPQDKLSDEYKNADAFVLTSLGEGMALVGLEAMSSGLPIICSKNTGLTDVVVDGYNGWTFDAGDDGQLSSIILKIKENKSMLSTVGNNARKSAKAYTWDQYGENVVNALEQIHLRREK